MDPMAMDKMAPQPEPDADDMDESSDIAMKASLMDEIMQLIDQSAVKRLPKKPGEEAAAAPSMPPIGA